MIYFNKPPKIPDGHIPIITEDAIINVLALSAEEYKARVDAIRLCQATLYGVIDYSIRQHFDDENIIESGLSLVDTICALLEEQASLDKPITEEYLPRAQSSLPVVSQEASARLGIIYRQCPEYVSDGKMIELEIEQQALIRCLTGQAISLTQDKDIMALFKEIINWCYLLLEQEVLISTQYK